MGKDCCRASRQGARFYNLKESEGMQCLTSQGCAGRKRKQARILRVKKVYAEGSRRPGGCRHAEDARLSVTWEIPSAANRLVEDTPPPLLAACPGSVPARCSPRASAAGSLLPPPRRKDGPLPPATTGPMAQPRPGLGLAPSLLGEMTPFDTSLYIHLTLACIPQRYSIKVGSGRYFLWFLCSNEDLGGKTTKPRGGGAMASTSVCPQIDTSKP